MAYISPERSAPSETNEDDEIITELDFARLDMGDRLVLYFEDGKAYLLRVETLDEHGNVFGRAKLGLKGQFAQEIERWVDVPHRLQFRGSCERFEVERNESVVVGARPDRFEVGARAWFSFFIEQEERKSTTQVINEIKHLKSLTGEEKKVIEAIEKSANIDSR